MKVLIAILFSLALVSTAMAGDHRGGGWHGRGGGHGGWHGGGGILGPLIGGIIGYNIGRGSGPAEIQPWTPEWYSYCGSKYRSFDPQTGTYLGYDGFRHACR